MLVVMIIQARFLIVDPLHGVSRAVEQQIETAFPGVILPEKTIAQISLLTSYEGLTQSGPTKMGA
jgi:hypothetical protein